MSFSSLPGILYPFRSGAQRRAARGSIARSKSRQNIGTPCKVRADEPQVIGLGRINGSGRGGLGIVHQGLVFTRKSRTPILEARLEVWVKRRCLNKVGMD